MIWILLYLLSFSAIKFYLTIELAVPLWGTAKLIINTQFIYFAILFVILVFKKVKPKGWKKPEKYDWVYFIIVNVFLLFIFPTGQPEKYFMQNLNSVLFAPIFEEMFFRGIILAYLFKQCENLFDVALSIICCSMLFLFHHYIFYPEIFIFSVLVSILYYKTRSLLLCILTHSIVNTYVLYYN